MSYAKLNGKTSDAFTSLDHSRSTPLPSIYYPAAERTSAGRKRHQRRLVTYGLLLTCIITLVLMLSPSRSQPIPAVYPSAADNIDVSGVVPEDHHLSKDTLVITLNYTESETPSVRVTLTNYHYSTKVSMLMWDSPFDEQAVALGVFSIMDRATGKEATPLGLKMSRLLPPKSEDFLELGPRHAVTKDVGLTEPSIALAKGRSYDVKVKAKWKGVWHANGKHNGEQRLRLMDGPTGLITWEYETNKLQIDVR